MRKEDFKTNLQMLLFGAFIIFSGWYCSPKEIIDADKQFEEIKKAIQAAKDSSAVVIDSVSK